MSAATAASGAARTGCRSRGTSTGPRRSTLMSDRDVAVRAIASAVDAALGEVARQQGAIAPNVAAEARRGGIAAGLALVGRPGTAYEGGGCDCWKNGGLLVPGEGVQTIHRTGCPADPRSV